MREKDHIRIHRAEDDSIPTPTYNPNRIQNRFDEAMDNYEKLIESDALAITGMAVASVGITTLVQLYRLRCDSRPWAKKAMIIGMNSGKVGLMVGAISVIVHETRDFGMGVENLAPELTDALGIEAFGELFGSALGIEAAIASRFLIIALSAGVKGENPVPALRSYGPQFRQASVETIVFFSLGLLADCLTPIPEPNLNALVTGLRILYSAGKLGFEHQKNVKMATKCALIRIEHHYYLAQKQLSAGN